MLKKITLTLFSLCCISFYGFGQNDSLNILLSEGKEDYENEKFVSALKAYRKAFSINDKSFEAAMGLGDSQHKLEMFQQAIESYDQAEKIKKDDAELYFNRGAAKVFVEDYRKAIKDFDQSIELRPDFPDVYYYRAYCYGALERYRNAIDDYNKAIELRPGYAAAIYNRGAAKAELGDYEAGKADFETALKEEPELENGKINIALSMLGMKKYEEAIQGLTEVINNRDDDLARAYFYRGEARYEIDRKKDACNDWQKAANLGHIQASKNANSFCDKDKAKKKSDIDIIF